MNYSSHTRCRKLILPIFIFISVVFMSFKSDVSFPDPSVQVTLKMYGLKPEKSAVMVAIFQNSETFLGDKHFKSLRIENPGKTSVSKIIDLPKGMYGVAVFQDLNGNEKLDKNFIGIPSEPYCFSNGEAGRFGPPSWNQAVVSIDKDAVMEFSF